MSIRKITDLDQSDLVGKTVLLRADFNVPLGENNIVDQEEAWRIEKGMATITYLRDSLARVVVISHLGRSGASLRPVAEYINQTLDFDLGFIPAITGDLVEEAVASLPQGGVLLLENLRQHPGEKENDASFAEELSTYADIYVNDAFSVSHREHASVARLPGLLPSYAGVQCVLEYENLSEVRNPKKPACLILGGAKFGTKLSLLQEFVDKMDVIFVGGALANNFFQAMGHSIGQSLVDESASIVDLVGRDNLVLPVDVVVQDLEGATRVIDPTAEPVLPEETIVDCGPKTLEKLSEIAETMNTILWNGPLGNYEIGFDKNTRMLARNLVETNAKIFAGGGDTVTVLQMEKLTDQYAFVSTAGGAMLDFLVDGELVGLQPLLSK